MEPNEVVRADFPEATPGFEKKSVEAHLEAVAAQLSALKARVRALEVELNAVRSPESGAGSRDPVSARPAPALPLDPPAESPRPEGDLVAARLVATELVLGGTERAEVIARIEAGYGVEDAAGLVDEVITRTG